jgi:hypothetical protein
VTIDGKSHAAKLAENNAFVTIEAPCPKCKAPKPLVVVGRDGSRHHDHDTYHADATCKKCGETIGDLRAKVSTIFGIEEDERVLHGRPRVY